MGNGELLPGQQYNPSSGYVIPYTEQVVNDLVNAQALIGTDATEITPMDANAWKVRTFDLTAINGILDAFVSATPAMVTLDLPDTLTAVAIESNSNVGAGSNSHPGTQQGFYFHGSGSGSLNPRSSAQGNAAVLLDAQPKVKYFRSGKYPGMRYFFYMPEQYDRAALLLRLAYIAGALVNDLPVFKTEAVVLTLKGANVSGSAEAASNVSVSDSPNNYSGSYEYGGGTNVEIGISNKTVAIPPTLHDVINLSPSAVARTIIVGAQADTLNVVTTNINVTPITNAFSTGTLTATATVAPSTISATTPTDIPRTGLYLVDLEPRPSDFDRTLVFAEVVDFSQFA